MAAMWLQNVIDMKTLNIHHPETVHDLPTGILHPDLHSLKLTISSVSYNYALGTNAVVTACFIKSYVVCLQENLDGTSV